MITKEIKNESEMPMNSDLLP